MTLGGVPARRKSRREGRGVVSGDKTLGGFPVGGGVGGGGE